MAETHEILYGYREDLFNVYLEVYLGTPIAKKTIILPSIRVDKMTGGGAKGTDTKYRPANGYQNELSLGGPKTIENISLTRLYDEEIAPKTIELVEAAGRARVIVIKEPLDEEGSGVGSWGALQYTGRLVDVTPPTTDSEGDKASTIVFAVSLESTVGQ